MNPTSEQRAALAKLIDYPVRVTLRPRSTLQTELTPLDLQPIDALLTTVGTNGIQLTFDHLACLRLHYHAIQSIEELSQPAEP